MERKQYTIGELSGLSGLSRRAIHYYVQQKLLQPPLGAGRGFYYLEEHLERLRLIGDLQQKGLSLDEIRVRVAEGPADQRIDRQAPVPVAEPPTLWVHLQVMTGIELHLQNGLFRLSPARLEQLRRKMAEVAHSLLEPLTPPQE